MNEKNKTCCFSGHRSVPWEDYPKIEAELERNVIALINQGVLYFGVGGAVGFDMLAERVILRLREKYPIKLILVLPCPPEIQTMRWSASQRAEYAEILNQADKVRILSPKYTNGCMHSRNRHLVDNSGHLICYLRENHGGTYYTVNYASQNGLNIIRI